jgi:hypothetical protein
MLRENGVEIGDEDDLRFVEDPPLTLAVKVTNSLSTRICLKMDEKREAKCAE